MFTVCHSKCKVCLSYISASAPQVFMSEQTYISKPIEFRGVLTKQPILLSDSKGRGLIEHVSMIENLGYSIEFQYRGGARLLYYFHWLKRNLATKVQHYGHIVLYIYLGTCDLTVKIRFCENWVQT